MKNKKAIFWISAFVIVAGAAFYFLYWKKKQDNETGLTQAKTTGTKASPLIDMDFPIKKGSRSPKVLTLQKALNRKWKANIAEDGVFGDQTMSAIRKFYQLSGFPVIATDVNEFWYNTIIK